MTAVSECPGCSAELAEIDEPAHRYIGASAACWDVYTRFLAGDSPIPSSRWESLLNDAYAAQHPGGSSPQATQSVAVHVVVLTGVVSDGHPPAIANDLRLAAITAGREVGGYVKLEPIPPRWELTVPDLSQATPDKRAELTDRYVKDVLARWDELHGDRIDKWLEMAVSRLGAVPRPRRS